MEQQHIPASASAHETAYVSSDSNEAYPAYIPKAMRANHGESYTDQKAIAEVPGAMESAPVELSSEQTDPRELMANETRAELEASSK